MTQKLVQDRLGLFSSLPVPSPADGLSPSTAPDAPVLPPDDVASHHSPSVRDPAPPSPIDLTSVQDVGVLPPAVDPPSASDRRPQPDFTPVS